MDRHLETVARALAAADGWEFDTLNDGSAPRSQDKPRFKLYWLDLARAAAVVLEKSDRDGWVQVAEMWMGRTLVAERERDRLSGLLDAAWKRINALGGPSVGVEETRSFYNDAIGDALAVIEELGGSDTIDQATERAPAEWPRAEYLSAIAERLETRADGNPENRELMRIAADLLRRALPAPKHHAVLNTAFIWPAEAYDAAWEAVRGEERLTLARQRLSIDNMRTIIRTVLQAVEPAVRAAIAYERSKQDEAA